jgi:cytochrome c biogenesis protein CcmG/thiol:disulfide interchange protein DsbE
MRARRLAVAAAAVAALLLAACSPPTDVTESAGSPQESAPGPAPAGSADMPEDLRSVLPPCPTSSDAPEVARGLPAVLLPCLGPGDPVALAGLRGTPMVLNAWASWCQPCRAELPALASFAEEADGRVAVLGLNALDDAEAAATLWAQLAMPFPSVSDPEAATRSSLRWVGLPVTYLVDSEGMIVYRHDGAVTDAEEWAALVEQHLGVT